MGPGSFLVTTQTRSQFFCECSKPRPNNAGLGRRHAPHAGYGAGLRQAGDQTIMDIAGHARRVLARYSHIRMEAKRKAL